MQPPSPNLMNNNEHLCWADPLCNTSLFHLRLSGWLQQEHQATCMELFLMSFVSGTFKVQEPQRCSLITWWFFWERKNKTMMNVCCLSLPQHFFPLHATIQNTESCSPDKVVFSMRHCQLQQLLFSVKALCHCSLCAYVSVQHQDPQCYII